MKVKLLAVVSAIFLCGPFLKIAAQPESVAPQIVPRTAAADEEFNYSFRDEGPYQKRPEPLDVLSERKKAGLIIGLLVCGPLLLFAISGFGDRRYHTRFPD